MPCRFCQVLASRDEIFQLVPTNMQLAEPVWHMPDAVFTILDSWWWTERPSKTCRVLIKNKINLRYCAFGWFYYRDISWCKVLETSNLYVLLLTGLLCSAKEGEPGDYSTPLPPHIDTPRDLGMCQVHSRYVQRTAAGSLNCTQQVHNAYWS